MTHTLFVGLGDVGGAIFDFLARTPGQHHFLVAGRNLDMLRQRTNLARFAALQLGYNPEIQLASMDLQNVEQTAEAIAQFQPEIVVCAVTMQKWGIISELPPAIRTQFYQAQLGPWLPVHMVLVHKLMQAIHQAGITAKVLNATYPDAVNPILHKVGLAPMTGIGDLANNIPALRLAVATELDAPVEHVEVRLVAHHFVSYWMHRQNLPDDAPFSFQALVGGKDITSQLNTKSLFASLFHQFKRTPGSLMTAVSAASVFAGLTNDTGQFVHVPGPNGLPGGYPARVDREGIHLDLPAPLTLAEAIEINVAGQQREGIARIDDDGTVHFAERNMAAYKTFLGYDCLRMPLADVEFRAQELLTKYQAFVQKMPQL